MKRKIATAVIIMVLGDIIMVAGIIKAMNDG